MRPALFAVLALIASAMVAIPSTVRAHALQPGYLEVLPLGENTWRVLWKKPVVGGQPMAIDALLPEACSPRRAQDLRFDGTAYIAQWVAQCSEGLQGQRIEIEGLSRTQTDVLVRYAVTDGQAETQRLTPDAPGFDIPAPRGAIGVFAAYVPLGLEHILSGPDHLLFVFALILLIRSPGRLVGAITAFTVAHSITLAAATLGWIVVPVPPVEAVIALSIMFLAAELVSGNENGDRLSERAPWMVSFGFGLLHGLGFASALLEVGLPREEVPLALLAFNVGVEIGQLLFVACVLLAGAALGRLFSAAFKASLAPGGRGRALTSYAIGGVAGFWFVERIAAF